MRILAALILTSFLSLSFTAQAQSKIDPEVRKKVLEAKAEAIRVIRSYSANTQNDRELRNTAKLMADSLEVASTVPAVGVTFAECQKDTSIVADTSWIELVIAICRSGMTGSKNDLIQTFIHESYHLYEGAYYIPQNYPEVYKNLKLKLKKAKDYPEILKASEKRAATVELEIMMESYGCVFSETSYFSDLLGLVIHRDFKICE